MEYSITIYKGNSTSSDNIVFSEKKNRKELSKSSPDLNGALKRGESIPHLFMSHNLGADPIDTYLIRGYIHYRHDFWGDLDVSLNTDSVPIIRMDRND